MAQASSQHLYARSTQQFPIAAVYANTWHKGQLPCLPTVWPNLSLEISRTEVQLSDKYWRWVCAKKKKPHKECIDL